jgi:hypothetical protein
MAPVLDKLDFAAKTHRRDAESAENFKNMRGEA